MRDIYKKNIDKFMKFINEDNKNEKPLVIKEEVKIPNPPPITKDNIDEY